MKNIKIIIATHKEYFMPSNDMYLPVHVGKEGKADIGYQGDNEGENISIKNPYFCELTGLYWAWKNLPNDYLGLIHYRRFFTRKGRFERKNQPLEDLYLTHKEASDLLADYDVIVCCGFQFAGIGNLAQENPDTKFILIDSWPTIDGTEVTADQVIDNVYAAYYAEQESGFYAGMAAALSTTTGKVAVVNGIAYPSNVNYQYGFECGVKYVNGTEGMNVEVVELPSYAGTDVTGANVGGNYVGNFSDEATGKVLGNALIAEGVDILFVAAGGSGNGVFTAAKEADGVKVIGCDVDQYDDGANGDSNIVLTSGLKVMHDTVYNVLNEVKDGSFKGANVTLTAADDATGFVSEEGRCQLTAEAIEKINAAQALLKEGKIVPAANFNGVTPETFTW